MFKDRVIKIVRDIPKGKTLTYKEVAALAGSPNASRAVGNIMKGNLDKDVLCHRVVKSDGTTGGYNRGKDAKKRKLREEGAIK
ncbi:MAG: MGMT family protein [Candidatus Pacebacteria bacterium]|jgi:O-6-methylguanine DNA methyltransferase|nr:6-O-methylguanine DNA methyltransferase [bacterium]MDP6527776.1 MGMT family protein [Candidatus Paceibacterota bacterium]MDP6659613.1 MGMT family protein [Candidatus Paceibacterota bacterium]|tara:strand:- start:41902 stop:42150 length:249 start_codon:yes stop_codon:yes gene_type:complete